MSYWIDAFTTAAYIINHMTSMFCQIFHLMKWFFCQVPYHSLFRMFCCFDFPSPHPYNKMIKLQPRSTHCIFLGCSNVHKDYKCLHIASGHLYISRDALCLMNVISHFLYHLHHFPRPQPDLYLWLFPHFQALSCLQMG